jgi:hypothetical protein
MASTINATPTSSGLIQTADNTGVLALQTGGTTAVTIATNQVVTLAQPLPAASGGTGLTSVGTSGNVLTSNGTAWTSSAAPSPAALSTASGSAPSYSARAWVNFNGTGTVAIRASGNVSSVSDDGTGTYTINFTTALPDANYNVVSNGPPNSTSVVGGLGFVVRNSSPSGSPSNKTTTQVQMMYAGTGSLVDASELYASVFR